MIFPGPVVYIASKMALITQARMLTVEWMEKDVQINLASPGPAAVPIWASLGLSSAQAESIIRSISQRPVDGSSLGPKKVIDVVRFLLSSKSAGFYRQELVVDKGYGPH